MTAVDTNILIYSCDLADSRRQHRAIEIIEESRDGVLLWQVASEFVGPSRKLASQGFTRSQAWSRLEEFMALFPLILSDRASASTRNANVPGPWLVFLGRNDYRRMPGLRRTNAVLRRSSRRKRSGRTRDR
jgi:hypothetical protein